MCTRRGVDFGSPGGARFSKNRLRFAFIFSSFGAIFEGSWLGFPPQLASQNPPKSIKNRCQEAPHLGLKILIVFGSQLGPSEPNLALAG